jgi:DNA-binding MarR family transcriptional regulator
MKILSRGVHMAHPTKADLKRQVIAAAREYGINTVLFRNMVGERLGVNVTDMECLGLVFNKGLATPSELARHTGLSSGATTAMLDRLEKSGLIERQPNPDDRRGTLIVLAKAGVEKVAPWFASVRKAQEKLVSSYSEEELQLILDFFEKSTGMWEEERKKLRQELEGK